MLSFSHFPQDQTNTKKFSGTSWDIPGTIVVKLHMYIYVEDYIHEQKKHEHTLKEKKTHT